MTSSDRAANLARLVDAVVPIDPDAVGPGRYAAVQEGEGEVGGYLTCHETFEDACAYLADDVLDGWSPVAVYDLDTAEVIGLHVSTPVVSRSEDQALTENLLAPEAK